MLLVCNTFVYHLYSAWCWNWTPSSVILDSQALTKLCAYFKVENVVSPHLYQNMTNLIMVEILILIRGFQTFQWSQELAKNASIRNLRPYLQINLPYPKAEMWLHSLVWGGAGGVPTSWHLLNYYEKDNVCTTEVETTGSCSVMGQAGSPSTSVYINHARYHGGLLVLLLHW